MSLELLDLLELPDLPVLMMLGACGIGLLFLLFKGWDSDRVIYVLGGAGGLLLLSLAHQPLSLAIYLLLLTGLIAAGGGRQDLVQCLRYPGLAVLFIGVGGLLFAFPTPLLIRWGALAIVLGILCCAGLFPYLRQEVGASHDLRGDPLLWNLLFAPFLVVVVFFQVLPELPSTAQVEVRIGSLVFGVINLAWGVLSASRATEASRLWRDSSLADWGLILIGWGLSVNQPGELAALLLLLSLPLVRLPLYLASREAEGPSQGAGRRGALLSALALIGAAPFVGFIARYQLFLAAASAAMLGVIPLVVAMLLYLAHWKRLSASLINRSAYPMVLALCFGLGLSFLASWGVWWR